MNTINEQKIVQDLSFEFPEKVYYLIHNPSNCCFDDIRGMMAITESREDFEKFFSLSINKKVYGDECSIHQVTFDVAIQIAKLNRCRLICLVKFNYELKQLKLIKEMQIV